MKKFLAIALLCAPFASIVCADVFTMSQNGEPGVGKLFIKMPGENVVHVMAPCKEGDKIQYGATNGSGGNMRKISQSIACGGVGKMTIN